MYPGSPQRVPPAVRPGGASGDTTVVVGGGQTARSRHPRRSAADGGGATTHVYQTVHTADNDTAGGVIVTSSVVNTASMATAAVMLIVSYVGIKSSVSAAITFTHSEWTAYTLVLAWTAALWLNALLFLPRRSVDTGIRRWAWTMAGCVALAAVQTNEARTLFLTSVGRSVFLGTALLYVVPTVVLLVSVAPSSPATIKP